MTKNCLNISSDFAEKETPVPLRLRRSSKGALPLWRPPKNRGGLLPLKPEEENFLRLHRERVEFKGVGSVT